MPDSSERVLWENIIEMRITESYEQKSITIVVNNPDEYINRLKNPILRQIAKYNYKMVGSPISISANTLKCTHEELENILLEQFAKYGQGRRQA